MSITTKIPRADVKAQNGPAKNQLSITVLLTLTRFKKQLNCLVTKVQIKPFAKSVYFLSRIYVLLSVSCKELIGYWLITKSNFLSVTKLMIHFLRQSESIMFQGQLDCL